MKTYIFYRTFPYSPYLYTSSVADTTVEITEYTYNTSGIRTSKHTWTVSDTQYLLYDGLGSTRQLAEYDSATGTLSIINSYSYDSYGVLLQDKDNSPPNGSFYKSDGPIWNRDIDPAKEYGAIE